VTAAVIRLIACDAPDCDTEHGCPLALPTHTALRAYLAEQGWTRAGRRDLCPDHSTATARTTDTTEPTP